MGKLRNAERPLLGSTKDEKIIQVELSESSSLSRMSPWVQGPLRRSRECTTGKKIMRFENNPSHMN
jgi:hypothetical protein